jgi:hypothetical protein
MSKVLATIFLGVFVGALTYEILRRVNPEFIERVEAKAADTMDSLLKVEGQPRTA